jgi:DNA polymerase-3 subunit delta
MLIFLYGADTFRSNEKLRALKNKYFEKNSSGTDLSVLDYTESATIKEFQDAMAAQGLFSSKRLIIILNSLAAPVEKQKEILEFLKLQKNIAADVDTVVIFFENSNPKKNLSLYKYLEKNSKQQQFEPLKGIKLEQWVLSYAKNISPNVSFSRPALNLLLSFTDNDLYLLSGEINKLVNYRNSGIISEDDVKLLVKAKIDSTMFETIEALASGNKSQALKLFHEQLEKGEDPYYILSMYVYQIRTLLKIGDFFWQGMTMPAQIAQASGLHPFVVQKSLSQVRNLSEAKVKKMFQDLANIDSSAKTGKVDPILALDSFIVSL